MTPSERLAEIRARPGRTLHHREQHNVGMQSFQKKYGLDLYAIAAELGRQYRARVQATQP